MRGDDHGALRAELDRLASAVLRMDAMSPVERQELVEAIARFESRFDRFEREASDFRREIREEMTGMRDDLTRIKAIARAGVWLVGAITGLAVIVAGLAQIGTR